MAKLIVHDRQGSVAELELGDETSVGRDAANTLPLADPEVSRRHAAIRRDPIGRYLVTDLGSANGTRLNAQRLLVPAVLRHGDVLAIGAFELRFTEDSAAETGKDRPGDDEETTSVRATAEDGVLIGSSAVMLEVFELVRKASASDLPVLIEGETGTGKELVARGVHATSRRAAAAFLAVNCAALSEALLESELFGHCRGAFTGATQDRIGLFEAAAGGTVFLDEIGEMPASMQAKLLRTLQEREVTRVGESRPRKADFRLLSATNRDLAAEAEAGRFRRDLYYRIAAFPIRLPPLRERREDIPRIASALLGAACRQARKPATSVAPEALALLERFAWPGNVRELKNEIERALALAADGEVIGSGLLSEKLRATQPAVAPAESSLDDPALLRGRTAEFERREILAALERHRGKRSPAARELGLTYQGLVKKIRRLGIADEDDSGSGA